MLAIMIDLLFVPVLLIVLLAYWRRRGPVERDMVLIFSAMAVFFIRHLTNETVGRLPPALNDVLTAIQLAQGWLTLRLLSRLRPVPSRLTRGAGLGYLGAVVLVFALPTPLPKAAVAYVIVMGAASGLAACVLLAQDARGRAGSARVRLAIAAVATGTFAVALMVNSIASFDPSVADAARTAARGVGLPAALGFAIAFVPPAWLRQWWATTAAYDASRHLLRVEATAPPSEIWQRYAHTVREIRGADAAMVLLPSEGGVVEVAGIGVQLESEPVHPIDALEDLLAAGQPVEVSSRVPDAPSLAAVFAHRIAARFVTAIPLRAGPGKLGALVLLSRYRSLFIDDDLSLLADLGTQSALIAERSTVLANQEKLNVTLAASVDALTAANQAKTNFLTNMSHELRTPLNAIIGFSDLMKHEPEIDERRNVPARWVEHVHTSGWHLLELVNDLLDLAKVEAGRMEIKLEPLSLATVADAAVSTLRPLAFRKHLQLTYEFPPLIVMADRIRLRQILDNLLSNAIKFTPDGGTVSISTRHEADSVLITVADTGVGIAPEDQTRVFEQFQQVGSRDLHMEGTGLGLALTRRLVELHGGAIDLTSELGKGTQITVHLPAAMQHPAAPLDELPPASAIARRGRHGVLIIEDDLSAAQLLRVQLESAGYPVQIAPDGRTGLAMARRDLPAAIVLDIVLPGVDGWDVLRELKSDPGIRDIPVVIATIVDEKEVGMALGAVDYFVKPIDADALRTRLAQHMLASDDAPAEALAIDDDPVSLDLVATVLAKQGINVATAATGTDGVRLAHKRHFDLILCDLLMPDLDGFSVIAALADNPETRQVPVLVVTGQDLSETDKTRLNGKILGVVHKGEALHDGLLSWLTRVALSRDVSRSAPVAEIAP